MNNGNANIALNQGLNQGDKINDNNMNVRMGINNMMPINYQFMNQMSFNQMQNMPRGNNFQ